jgi:predicted dehydrogenase
MALCDLDAEKLERNVEKYGITETYPSLNELCQSDIDAAVIITQPWLHAAHAIQTLRAGKHVYSAVPTAMSVKDIAELVKTVEESGKIYMLGETSFYYPETIYCRQQYAKGAFGHIVYGEGEYYHDWDHGLYDVAKWRGGENWRWYNGNPPMYYPTHSTSMIISVTGAHMTHVSCQGFVDTADDGIYKPEANLWRNVFSNESALFRMSDGSACRINEFRRIGHPGAVRMTLFGTEGSFEHGVAGAMWLTKDRKAALRLDDLLAARDIMTEAGTFSGFSSLHEVSCLPRTFANLPTGHSGSHQFLVDDFVKACVAGKHPPVNVWQAARYAVAGLLAHESAIRGGALLEVPDFGDPPR